MQSIHLVHPGDSNGVLEVFGPKVEFLTPLQQPDAGYCAMIGTIPPGVSVPLHSHPDLESFFLLSGSAEALCLNGEGFEWATVNAGDFVHVPSNAKHAWRNTGSVPAVQLITTTPKLGKFFQEIGRTLVAGKALPPPTPDELHRFMGIAASYGYWLGSPEENAAVGISLF